MEIASNKGVIADASTPAGHAGMSERSGEKRSNSTVLAFGWVIMSIRMAIGAGIVFLPVQSRFDGIVGIFALSVIGCPTVSVCDCLLIRWQNHQNVKDYPSVISGYLGKNTGASC